MEAPVIDAILRGPRLFPNGVALLSELYVGDPVGLLREPTNPVDSNAVIIMNMDEFPMGYVQREKSAELALWMDRGWIYTAKVIAGPIVAHIGRRLAVKTDSVIIRCTPLKPIKLAAKIDRSATVPNHINCRSRLVKT